jgi:hypothetical protein
MLMQIGTALILALTHSDNADFAAAHAQPRLRLGQSRRPVVIVQSWKDE